MIIIRFSIFYLNYFCVKRNIMKHLHIYLIFIFFIFLSCNNAEKKGEKFSTFPNRPKKNIIKKNNNVVQKGKELFTSKTCATCHLADKKVIGPSIKEINGVYKSKKGSIIDFLQGKTKAIVDTTPAQVAIMKANIDGFLKDVTVTELKAIETYMLSIK